MRRPLNRDMNELKPSAVVRSVLLVGLMLLLVGRWSSSLHGAAMERSTEARPIFVGNYPDPSILRDGDDYYLTHTTLRWQPALVIWHSKDLKEWRPISSAAVNLNSSVWAPDLIKHEGRYHIYFPGVPRGNYLTSADDIRGPWSHPVQVENCPGIDPGHVVDVETGQRYLHVSGGNAARLSKDGRRLEDEVKKVYSGWPIPSDWDVECPCLESPKLVFRGGWYYLTSAQGGTAGPATSHMVVSARSRSPVGPWQSSPFNPIIRTWSPEEDWISKGHGTIFEGPRGRWWSILHGYRNGYRSLGRSILLEPIEWTNEGWFRVADQWPEDWEGFSSPKKTQVDEFDGEQLSLRWQFYESLDANRIHLTGEKLVLKGFGDQPGRSRPMAWMAGHPSYQVEVDLELEGNGEVGLLAFYDPDHYSGIGLDASGRLKRVSVGMKGGNSIQPLGSGIRRVWLRMDNRHHDVSFRYRFDVNHQWTYLPSALDASMAHHNNWGEWHSLRPALYVTGSASAHLRRFTYTPGE